jgi:hypothetical protein
MQQPNSEESVRRDEVMCAIRRHVREDRAVKLPAFDPSTSIAAESALLTVGAEPNPFSGTLGEFRYQFEGEEDLLHLIVTRVSGGALSPEEGQAVAGFVLDGVPPGLVWFRPGDRSQHFYVGHDELLR